MTTIEKDIPTGWKLVKLGDVCEFLDSKRKPIKEADRSLRISGKSANELYPYYGANGQVGLIDGYLFDEPTILLAEDGGHFGSKERPIAYKVQGRYWVNNHAHVLKPKNNIDFDFLFHSMEIRPDVGNLVQGATRAKLNLSTAKQIPIPLPPLEEQKRIAGILNKAEEIKKLREEADKKTEELVPAIFHEMVGRRIKKGGDLPSDWKWVSLGDVMRLSSGKGLTKKTMVGHGIHPVYGGNGITGYHNEFLLEQPTLVIGRVGANCGAVHHSLPNAWITDNALFVTTKLIEFDDTFMYWFLTNAKLNSLSQGAAQPLVSSSILSPLPIPFPPLEEQNRIARRLNEAEEIKKTNAESVKKIENLKSSLLQKAFRGEL